MYGGHLAGSYTHLVVSMKWVHYSKDRSIILPKDLCLIEKENFTTFRKMVVSEIT